MLNRLFPVAAFALMVSGCTATSDLRPFEVQPPVARPPVSSDKATCGFPGLELPSDVAVYAAGAYSGRKIEFQIDQSGHSGTQIDVAVNSPNRPVVLILGAYEPTIWNIGWSQGTRILAVLVSGYHRQAVAGLQKGTPVLNSSYDNKGPCGWFYVKAEHPAVYSSLGLRSFGRPVDMVFLAEKGRVFVGNPLATDIKFLTSSDTPPVFFYDKDAPLAGPAGLEDAVRKGLLKKASVPEAKALAEEWIDAFLQKSGRLERPPAADQVASTQRPTVYLYNAYIVLKPFTYPAGLYGAHSAKFIIPKGIPRPEGNPGHSTEYDFNDFDCRGPSCRK